MSRKHLLFNQFAIVAKALAHPIRLELLDLLAQGEKAVETLVSQSGHPLKNVSAHLRTLRQAGLVATRRDGTRIFYSLADPSVVDLFTTLQAVGSERLAAARELVREYFTAPEGFEPVGLADLSARVDTGDITVIDVRPEDEYAHGHVPGALSVPLDQLHEWLPRLPRDREIVAYCRGPYCLLALDAAAILARHGFQVRHLPDGMPGWARHGLPVAAGSSPQETP